MTRRHIKQAIGALLKEQGRSPQRDTAEAFLRQALAWVEKMEATK